MHRSTRSISPALSLAAVVAALALAGCNKHENAATTADQPASAPDTGAVAIVLPASGAGSAPMDSIGSASAAAGADAASGTASAASR